MNVFRSRHTILLITSALAYLFSLQIVSVDVNFTYRWIAFGFHIVSLLIVVFLYLSTSVNKKRVQKLFSMKEGKPLALIIGISLFTHFSTIVSYPFTSISDELRDAGLFAMKITAGAVKNIFDYGSYDGYGLIIPTLTIPFYYLFGSSTLAYRFPAALLALAAIILMYLLIRIVINKQTAFWTALVLATLPLHIFFARTQVVVAFNLFFVPVILLSLYRFFKHRSYIDYIFLGTLLGFVCGFHAAIEAFALLVLLIILFVECKEAIAHNKHKERLLNRFSKLLLLFCFMLVGFGPRLLFTTPKEFFHMGRLGMQTKVETTSSVTSPSVTAITNKYLKSLMVYTYEPAQFFYQENKPIFSPLLALFFLLGVGYAVFVSKNNFVRILLVILVGLPFFTSAITDRINADHRVTPLLAVGAVFVGLGIVYSLGVLKNSIWKILLIVVIGYHLFFQVVGFYVKQPANLNVSLYGYLSMHTLYFLQTDKHYQVAPTSRFHAFGNTTSTVCWVVSPNNYQHYYGNPGILEQQQFFIPTAKVEYLPNPTLLDNEIYVVKRGCAHVSRVIPPVQTYAISCKQPQKTFCPIDYKGEIKIYY